MGSEWPGRVEGAPEIRVEIAGGGPPGMTGKQGPPGESPYVGENGTWWVGRADTGVPATGGPRDHAQLTNRDMTEQHPIEAIDGLLEALNAIPNILERLNAHELNQNAHPYLVVDGNNKEN